MLDEVDLVGAVLDERLGQVANAIAQEQHAELDVQRVGQVPSLAH